MFKEQIKESKVILNHKLNIIHFMISLVLTATLIYGLMVLSIVLGWLFFMEPASSSSMFSNFTLLIIIIVNLILVLSILIRLYRFSKRKENLVHCKSYILLLLLVVSFYLSVTPSLLLNN